MGFLRVELYWSKRESESDITWNEYIDFSVVCLHWVAMSSDKARREFSLSLQYNSTLTRHYQYHASAKSINQ